MLADQKREQANSVVLQLVVQIAQPLVFDLAQVLRFINKKYHSVIVSRRGAAPQKRNSQIVRTPGGSNLDWR